MNCKCLGEIENRVLNKFQENNPEYGKLISAKFENKYLDLELEPAQTVIGIPLKIEYQRGVKVRKTTLCMSIKYCPFCGKSISEVDENE